MTRFSRMWVDVEDQKAGPDTAANCVFVQHGLDVCTGRIVSGLYGNAGSIPRICGDSLQFAPYPFFDADGAGVPVVRPVAFNALTASYDQYVLDTVIDGVACDVDVRVTADGRAERGLDLSNYSGVPGAQWFANRWAENYRFLIFGDQMPYVTRAQVANMEASGQSFDPQLYTYLNFPGGDYYANEDGATQITLALDALGVPAYTPPPTDSPAPTTASDAQQGSDDVQLQTLNQTDSIAAFNLVASRLGHEITGDAGENVAIVTDPAPPPGYTDYKFRLRNA